MTFFADLSAYRFYTPGDELNIGWLDPFHDFPTGPVKAEILEKLKQICTVSVTQTRGFHICKFCEVGRPETFAANGKKYMLGSAEVRVFGRDGTVFAAPNLILHYILQHNYRPPTAFLEAIEEGFCPPDTRYFALLRMLGRDFE